MIWALLPLAALAGALAALAWRRGERREADASGASGIANAASTAVSGRQEAEAALAESQERFRSLILRAAFGIYRSAPDGRFLDVNPALVRMLGYRNAEELLRVRMPQDVFADAQESAHLLEHELDGDRPHWANLRWKKKCGALIDVRLSSRAVRDGDGAIRYYEGIAEDITERLRREEALRHSERMASLGHTLSGVAHELNNPLAAISGFAQLLLRQWRDEDDRSALETVHREATRAGKIVRDLLTFARRQDSHEREILDLNEVVRYIVAAQRYAVETRGIHHQESLAEGLPPVLANGSQMEQVVLNLVVNARQALEAQLDVPLGPAAPARPGGAGAPLIAVRTREAGGWVILEVEDNGPGILPEDRGRIFDPFWTTKQEGEGTGLGLSVVHGIVTAHGGTIEVESDVGRGARFRIALPAAPAALAGQSPGAAERSGAAASLPPGIARRPLDMLIVDDEESILELLTRYFGERGHAVITAASGAEAVSVAAYSSFDVVVCDLRMPDMDGVETITRLRALPGTTGARYVLVTGDPGASQMRQQAERLEVAAVLQKPYDMEYLRTAVEGGG